MAILFLLLLALAAGALSTLYWIPEDDLGPGYFQINALIVVALLGLAAAALATQPVLAPSRRTAAGPVALAIALASASGYYALATRERWRLAKLTLSTALAASAAALLIAGPPLLAAGALNAALPHRDGLVSLALVTSAAVLGWSLITMLLGHWYLVVPRLAFRHLTVFCAVLLGALALRSGVFAAGLAAAASAGSARAPGPLALLTDLAGEGMFFWFRVLWGLAIPLALAAMALACARRRANQSATGILYVLLVGTLIGEISAFYLTLATGVPV